MDIDFLSPDNVRPAARLHGASVSLAQCNLSRKIGCGCSAALPQLGVDAVLGLHLTDEAAADRRDPLVLAGSFGSIELGQGGRLMRALTGIDIGEDADADDGCGQWLQAALLGRLAGTPFSCAERLTRTALPDAPDAFTLRVSLRSGTHAFSVHARASASAWLDFIGRATWTQTRHPMPAWRNLPCRITARIARHTLPGHALRTLRAGDIILPSNPLFTCNGEGLLQWGGLIARVRYLAPCALTITAVEAGVESQELEYEAPDALPDGLPAPLQAQQAQQEQQEQDDGASLDLVPVTLDFALGQVRMPMGALRTLGVGVIVPLTAGSPAAIAITSGGCTLGRGEAVDVDGQLGIRIVQWGVVEQ